MAEKTNALSTDEDVMRNETKWVPSKFVLKNGQLTTSQDVREVSIASRLMVKLIAQFYQSQIPIHVKGRLLDLGCGKAPLYLVYKNFADDVSCVDWENSLHINDYVDTTCDLSKKLPIEDEKFDTILLSDVLEHLPNPDKLWSEMFRLLVPGGKLILNVPFLYWIHEEPYDYYRYTEYALRRLAEQAGFSVVLLEPIGGFPEVLADIVSKFLLRYPVCKWLIIFIQRFTSWAIKTKLGRRTSQKTARTFPLGYFLIAQKARTGVQIRC